MQDINKKVDQYFLESANARQKKEQKWEELERFYRGKHWQYNEKRPVKNFIFSIIEGEIPVLTDSMPASDVVAKEPDKQETAQMLSSSLQYVYDKNNLQLKNSEIIRAFLKVGTGHFYVDYDPDADGGAGLPTIRTLPWEFCFPDAYAKDIEDALYFGIKMPMRAEEVKRKFPDKADLIKGETLIGDPNKDTHQAFIKPDVWDGIGGRNNVQGDNVQLNDMVIYEEMWHKDYELIEIPEEETLEEIAKEAEQFIQAIAPDIVKWEDHAKHKEAHEEFKMLFIAQALQLEPEMITELDIKNAYQIPELALILNIIDDHIEAHNEFELINPEGKKPKFENGLRLTIRVGKEILYDGKAPVNDGMIPIAPAYCYKDDQDYWGTGEIHNMLDAQKSFNEMDWHELMGLRLNTNSGWVVDEESEVNADTLTNEPGLVVVKRQGTEVRRLEPGQVSPQLAQRKIGDVQTMENISGVNEVSQGRRPTGITAGNAIQALQAQSIGRIRLKERYFTYYTLPRLAKLCLSRIIQYWKAERLLRMYDDNGKIQFFKFDPKMVENFDYDVRIVAGSTNQLNKEDIFTITSQLVEKGLISPKLFFTVNPDIPYRTKILEELEQNDQMALIIQQLQAENEQLKQIIEPALNQEQAAKQGS